MQTEILSFRQNGTQRAARAPSRPERKRCWTARRQDGNCLSHSANCKPSSYHCQTHSYDNVFLAHDCSPKGKLKRSFLYLKWDKSHSDQ